jgi:hypothetical protein
VSADAIDPKGMSDQEIADLGKKMTKNLPKPSKIFQNYTKEIVNVGHLSKSLWEYVLVLVRE